MSSNTEDLAALVGAMSEGSDLEARSAEQSQSDKVLACDGDRELRLHKQTGLRYWCGATTESRIYSYM
jgi:hypothetical protein